MRLPKNTEERANKFRAFLKNFGATFYTMERNLLHAIEYGLPEVFHNLEDRRYSYLELCDIIEANI